MFSSQSRSRIMHLRAKLASSRKGELSAAAYFAKMKGYANEMAAIGKRLEDDDIVSYILTGLDADYNLLVENINSRSEPISLSSLYAQLLSVEARLENQNNFQMSANVAHRGGYALGRGRGRDGGRGDRGRGGFGHGGRGSNPGHSKPVCQLCEKVGHTVVRCWKRFDRNFKPEEKSANLVAPSYGVDTNWYTDTGQLTISQGS
jgi:hypothetical protein